MVVVVVGVVVSVGEVVSVVVSVGVSVGFVVSVTDSVALVVTVGESATSAAARRFDVGAGSPFVVSSVCGDGSASGSVDLLDDVVLLVVSDERDGTPLRPSPTWAVGMGAVTVGVDPEEGSVAVAVADGWPPVGAVLAPPP